MDGGEKKHKKKTGQIFTAPQHYLMGSLLGLLIGRDLARKQLPDWRHTKNYHLEEATQAGALFSKNQCHERKGEIKKYFLVNKNRVKRY